MLAETVAIRRMLSCDTEGVDAYTACDKWFKEAKKRAGIYGKSGLKLSPENIDDVFAHAIERVCQSDMIFYSLNHFWAYLKMAMLRRFLDMRRSQSKLSEAISLSQLHDNSKDDLDYLSESLGDEANSFGVNISCQSFDPALIVVRQGLGAVLTTAINSLDCDVRSCLLIVKMDDRTPAEAAMALGITEAKVKSNLHQAMKTLREMLPNRRALATWEE